MTLTFRFFNLIQPESYLSNLYGVAFSYFCYIQSQLQATLM